MDSIKVSELSCEYALKAFLQTQQNQIGKFVSSKSNFSKIFNKHAPHDTYKNVADFLSNSKDLYTNCTSFGKPEWSRLPFGIRSSNLTDKQIWVLLLEFVMQALLKNDVDERWWSLYYHIS